MMKSIKHFPWLGLLPLILTLITSSWLADGIKGEALFSEWFPPLAKWRFYITIGSGVLFVISVLWLYNFRKVFLAVRTLEQLNVCKPHACLILLLSTPNLKPDSFHFPVTIKDKNGDKVTLEGTSLEDDIHRLDTIRWNWQQLLRGILPHKDTLEYVYLVGSQQSGTMEGSHGYIDFASGLIRRYCPSTVVLKEENPVNFEDLKELSRAILKALKDFKNQYGKDEDDIIIDVTSGQKTTSIAGAVVTLNSQITFQYVQTNEPHKVIAYDVVIHSPASI